ncbi:MAG: acyl-CoA thioesterase [Spartobacteria bacterium]
MASKLCGFISTCGLNKINIAAMTSPATYIHRRRVDFADTDAAGVAHFSRLLAMVEEAEHGFFRERGIPILTKDSAWPVVRVEVDFAGACRCGDEIEMRLGDFQPGKSSLAYAFEGAIDGRVVFSGKMTKCHISPESRRSVEISGEILESLKRKI